MHKKINENNVFEIIDRVSTRLDNEYHEKIRNSGEKVIGYVCSFVPQEILTAAGALPFRMRATGSSSTDKSEVYFSPTHCSFIRHTFNQALSGKYDFLDGIIFSTTCDHARRMFDNWGYANIKPSFRYLFKVPHVSRAESIRRFAEDLKKFAQAISGLTGKNITDKKLKEAIAQYNRQRSLLAAINELRKQQPPPVAGLEMLKLHQTLTSVPVDEGIMLLEKFIETIKNRKPVAHPDAIRLFLGASHYEDHIHMKAVESEKVVIVQDGGCIGMGHFAGLVEEKDDPYESLAERFLTRYSCPHCMDRIHDRTTLVQNSMDQWKCDGMLVDALQFCTYWASEGYIYQEICKNNNFPFLNLNHELYGGGTGQLKTRIEAFREQIMNAKYMKQGKETS